MIRGKSRIPAWAWFFALLLPCTPGALGAGRSLPNLKIQLVDGSVVRASDLAGEVVVIDFWGTWCKPCLAEIPAYNAFHRDYKDKGVRLLALAADSGTSAQVRDAARRLKIEYPVAAPGWDQLDLFGDLQVFPTTMVFDGKGKLVKEFLGAAPSKHEQLRALVDQLLKAQ